MWYGNSAVAQSTFGITKIRYLNPGKIPAGFAIRPTSHAYAHEVDLFKLRCIKKIHSERAYQSIGTLGGGNHFIEIDRDAQGTLYLVVHSGSRHLGVEVAKYYQNAGYTALKQLTEKGQVHFIETYKAKGKEKEQQQNLQQLKQQKFMDIPCP